MTPAPNLNTMARNHVEGFCRRRDLERDQPRNAVKESGGAAIGAVKVKDRLPDAVSVDPAPPVLNRPLFRPNCLQRESCRSGTPDHCWTCRKAMAAQVPA